MKILFLYSEVMPYTASVFKALVQEYKAEVHVVRWDKKNLTPFNPTESIGINYYNRSEFNEKQLILFSQSINPDLCFISGWMDKSYLKVGLELKKSGKPVLGGMDNQWNGTLKQIIGSLISKFKIKPYFTHLIVPGIYQYEFARRLGFSKGSILTKLYSADTNLFQKAYHQPKTFEKNILFVGRFKEIKGVDLLYSCFLEIQDEFPDWTLTFVGSGDLKEMLLETERIKVKNFSTSDQLVKEAVAASIFCLPSRKEPWGVVVHEFAACGLAMLTSDACGASTEFIIDGYNGYTFKAGSRDSLKHYLKILLSTPENELIKMGTRSYELSQNITPEISAAKIISVLN